MNFLPLLSLLFIALKLTNYIDWSWWLVLAPMYFPFIIVATMWFLAFVAGAKLTVKNKK